MEFTMLYRVIACFALIYSSVYAADAELPNWPSWRGVAINGTAPEANPPLTWSKDQNIRWKTALLGEGASTPIVWQNQVYILSAVKTDKAADVPHTTLHSGGKFKISKPGHFWRFVVSSYDRNTGKQVWQKTAAEAVPHEGHHRDNTFASGSPATDGNRLYVSFGSRGVFAYTMDGTLIWKRDLGPLMTRKSFGEASTPVVYAKSLILQWDQEENSMLYRLDAETGETIWKVARNEASNWSVPLVTEHKGLRHVVVSGHDAVISYNLDDGTPIWRCGGQTMNCIPSPVRLGDVVYCMSGFRGSGLYAISLDARGDVTETEKVVWKRTRDTPYVPSPLLYGDRLYFLKTNQGILTCVDARNGQDVIAPTRLEAIDSIYASPVGAGKRVYVTGRDGTTVVLKHSRSFEVLAENSLEDPIDASLAVVGDAIFARSHSMLYCIGE